ncbi:MAG: exodeoxyribonuclease VII small subunit [Clostridiales bacterium]|nr:exodeoxyribonuclease VII small subunit [Clostridiales bacterium]MDE6618592.1 exodeoxyribonuclease VII small subunit [Clostridiales bacterium]
MKNENINTLASGDFENKLDELQKIVQRLENDPDVTLEDSMSLYESGLKIAKQCVEDLAQLNARITELNKQLDLVIMPSLGDNDEN